MAEESQPQGIELKLDNGMVIKGANMEEALKSAAKIIEDNVKFSRETKAQLEELQNRYSSLETQVNANRPPKEPPSNGFDKDRYYQLLHDDPLAAQNYLDAARFGVPDPVAHFTQMSTKVSIHDGSFMAATFTNNHPEFPSDMESAKTLTGRVVELRNAGHPADINTMELAWSQLVNEGKLKPLEEEAPAEELPPSPGGSGGVISNDDLKKAESMSDKELAALLKSKGML